MRILILFSSILWLAINAQEQPLPPPTPVAPPPTNDDLFGKVNEKNEDIVREEGTEIEPKTTENKTPLTDGTNSLGETSDKTLETIENKEEAKELLSQSIPLDKETAAFAEKKDNQGKSIVHPTITGTIEKPAENPLIKENLPETAKEEDTTTRTTAEEISTTEAPTTTTRAEEPTTATTDATEPPMTTDEKAESTQEPATTAEGISPSEGNTTVDTSITTASRQESTVGNETTTEEKEKTEDIYRPKMYHAISRILMSNMVNDSSNGHFDREKVEKRFFLVTGFDPNSKEVKDMVHFRAFLRYLKKLDMGRKARNLQIPFTSDLYPIALSRIYEEHKFKCSNVSFDEYVESIPLVKENGHLPFYQELHVGQKKMTFEEYYIKETNCFGQRVLDRIPEMLMNRTFQKKEKREYIRDLVGGPHELNYQKLEIFLNLFDFIVELEPKYGHMATESFLRDVFLPLLKAETENSDLTYTINNEHEGKLFEEFETKREELEEEIRFAVRIEKVIWKFHNIDWVNFTDSSRVLEIIEERWKMWADETDYPIQPNEAKPSFTKHQIQDYLADAFVNNDLDEVTELHRRKDWKKYGDRAVEAIYKAFYNEIRRKIMGFSQEEIDEEWEYYKDLLKEKDASDFDELHEFIKEKKEGHRDNFLRANRLERAWEIIFDGNLTFLEKVKVMKEDEWIHRDNQDVVLSLKRMIYIDTFEHHLRSIFSNEAVDYSKKIQENLLNGEFGMKNRMEDLPPLDEDLKSQVEKIFERIEYEMSIDENIERKKRDEKYGGWMQKIKDWANGYGIRRKAEPKYESVPHVDRIRNDFYNQYYQY